MGNGVRVALVAAKAIGDGAISLILAHNLARNGFDVVFYSNPFSQLSGWLPWLSGVKPYPKAEDCEREFSGCDLVIADNLSVLGEAACLDPGKYLYLGLERVPQSLRRDHRQRLKDTLPDWKFQLLERIASYSGDIRFQRGARCISMVKSAAALCSDRWRLDEAIDSTGLTPPPELGLVPGFALRRVILHPFSGLERKNWPLRKYLDFARGLRRDGWEPEFCCAASERETLLAVIGDEFPVPASASLSAFAARIYESAALVGNDSGPVHLASALGVPTLTISLRGYWHRWRPDWRPGVVALPLMKIKLRFLKTVLWKPFTPVWHVRRGFDKLMSFPGSPPKYSTYV
jgi:heptosyltransferase III